MCPSLLLLSPAPRRCSAIPGWTGPPGAAPPAAQAHLCCSEPPGKDPRHGASTPRSQPFPPAAQNPAPQHRSVSRRTRGTGRSCCGAAQGRRRCVTQRGASVPAPRLALPSEQANMCAPSLFTRKHTRPRAAAAGRHRNQQRHELWRKSTAAKSDRTAAAPHALPAPCRSEHRAVAWVSQKLQLLCTAHYRNGSSFRPASSCCNRYSHGVLWYSRSVLLL